MFTTKGVIGIEKKPGMDDDEMMMLALDAGADDFDIADGYYEILTSADKFAAVRDALVAAVSSILPQSSIVCRRIRSDSRPKTETNCLKCWTRSKTTTTCRTYIITPSTMKRVDYYENRRGNLQTCEGERGVSRAPFHAR